MTSRDHLLGHANAVDHCVDEDAKWDRFPLGVPQRCNGETDSLIDHFEALCRPPTLAELLPTGDSQCTTSDGCGISKRKDIGKARIRNAVFDLGEGLSTSHIFRVRGINHDEALGS